MELSQRERTRQARLEADDQLDKSWALEVLIPNTSILEIEDRRRRRCILVLCRKHQDRVVVVDAVAYPPVRGRHDSVPSTDPLRVRVDENTLAYRSALPEPLRATGLSRPRSSRESLARLREGSRSAPRDPYPGQILQERRGDGLRGDGPRTG
jgi:hypothetical protein